MNLLRNSLIGVTSLAYSAATASAATTVTGQLVNVDFNHGNNLGGANPDPVTFAGDLTASTATYGVNWVDTTGGNDTWNGSANNIINGSLLSLKDSTDAATTVNVSWSGFGFTYNNYPAGRDGNPAANGPDGDGIFTSSDNTSTGTVTISGLSVGGIYNLTVIGAGAESDVHLNGAAESTLLAAWTGTSPHYVEFLNVAADVNGEIAFSVDGAASDAVGGFQITAVPEPSSAAALFGVVGLCAVALRRRK